jgi:3-hydroxyisobutyrate dehydrogenase-like beta-hydroxyacid dehydrogenase
MSDVAVIGLGRIGGGAVRSLARAGHGISGYDVSAEAIAAVAEQARGASSPRDAAQAVDVVFIAVFDDAQVREALGGPEGILAADPPPRAVVILSTVSTHTIEWAGEQAAAAGVGLLDCGVTGGSTALEVGSIVGLLGGDEATVEIVRPALSAFADPIILMGPLGSGMKAKLARNALWFGYWYTVSEAIRLAEASGVSVDKLIEACEAADRWSGGPLSLVTRHEILPTDGATADEASLARRRMLAAYAHKDVSAALALADELGVDMPGARVVEQRFDDAVGLSGL